MSGESRKLSWVFRVALGNISVHAVSPCERGGVTSAHTAARAETQEAGEVVKDLPTIYRFWSQFLDVPLPAPQVNTTTTATTVKAAPGQPIWESVLHFSYDGMEREVALEVRRNQPLSRTASSAAAAAAASSAARSSLHSHLSGGDSLGRGTTLSDACAGLTAVAVGSVFFSYSIEADCAESLAQSLAHRHAAVHVLLRRVAEDDRGKSNGAAAAAHPVQSCSPSNTHAGNAVTAAAADGNDTKCDAQHEGANPEVVVLASATVSLLDLAVSNDARFYFNIFRNADDTAAAAAAALDGSSLMDHVVPPRSLLTTSRRRTHLCGHVALTLRMDEEKEVRVRPRLICARGVPPSASFQLRYGWCTNEALSLGTRQKRAQASSSRESSPSRAPEHITAEALLPGVAQPCLTFRQDQLPQLQLTCSRTALQQQSMFFDVLAVPFEDGDAGEGRGEEVQNGEEKKKFTASAVRVASGQYSLQRVVVAAHHDSEIEAAFTVPCDGAAGADAFRSAGGVIPAVLVVDGVLQLSQIPTVRYALKEAAKSAAREGQRGPTESSGRRGAAERTRPHVNLVPAAALRSFHVADAAETAHKQKKNGGTDDGDDGGDERAPQTARPGDVAAASLASRDAHLMTSSLDAGEPLMTPPQSLRNYKEPLALSQTPFAALSLATSPHPFTALSLLPSSAGLQVKEATHATIAAAGVSPELQQGKDELSPATVYNDGHSEHGERNDQPAPSAAPSDSPRVPTPVLVPLLVSHHHHHRHSHPLHPEKLPDSTNAFGFSGTSSSSVVTPTFAADGFSYGDPSVSLPPVATPRAPSALPLDQASPLELLVRPKSAAGLPPSSQEHGDVNQRQLQEVAGGEEAARAGKNDTTANIRGSPLHARGDTLSYSALNEPHPHSQTVRCESAVAASEDSSPAYPHDATVGRINAAPRGDTTAVMVKEDAAAAQALRDHIDNTVAASSFLATADSQQLPLTARLSSRHPNASTALAEDTSNGFLVPSSEVPPPAEEKELKAMQYSVAPPGGLDPELVLHFCGDSSADGEDDKDSALGSDGSLGGAEGEEPAPAAVSGRATPASFSAASSVLRVRTDHSRYSIPQSVASVQLSPAPPPTLAPPPPGPPPAPLLPSNARAVAPTSPKAEQHYAIALRLSAQYRTLLGVYERKLSGVRAAEARAEVATKKVRAAQAGTRLPLAGSSATASSDPAQATAEWLERVQRETTELRTAMKDAHHRTQALRQRLTDLQTTQRAARAALQSRDDALALTEEELQQLMSQMANEKEEAQLPPLPSPPSTSRRGSSARPREAAAAAAAGASHSNTINKKTMQEAQNTNAVAPVTGQVRVVGGNDTPTSASTSFRNASSLQPSQDEGAESAPLFSPNPRPPASLRDGAPKVSCTAELFAAATTKHATSNEASFSNVAVTSAAVHAESSVLYAVQPATDPQEPTVPSRAQLQQPPPLPPPVVASAFSYRRSVPPTQTTTSPSPAPTRFSGYEAPSRSHSATLSDSSLSRLEQEALLDGIDKGDRPLVMHLLHTKPKLFYASNNLLHVACAARLPDAAVVEALLQVRPELTQGVDAHTGNSVLHVACAARYPHDEIVKKLVIHGVPAQMRNDAGLTAFHIAVLNRADLPRNRVKDTLLTLGDCSVDERTSDGRTALHLVCDSDANVAVVEYLLHRGADVDIAARVRLNALGAEETFTPLQLSIACRAELIMQLLQQYLGHSNSMPSGSLR